MQIFSADSGGNKETVIKLKREIEVNRKLDHPNIVRYIGSEIVSTQFCIYLEFMPGGSLANIYK